MGKVLPVKKGSKADFKKRTAKVGKRVERGNVTKISVHSKKIHMPSQQSVYLALHKKHSCFLFFFFIFNLSFLV